jgi:hypothetical protein
VVKSKTFIIIGIIGVAGVLAFFFLWPTEADRVKKQFRNLAGKIEKNAQENNIVSAAKANKIKDLFTPTCTIHAPAYDFIRDIAAKDLSTLILTGRAQYAVLTVDFYDITIHFEDPLTAEVIVTAKLTGQLTTGGAVDDIQELACTLSKMDDTWLFRKIEIVEVLEK